MKKISIMGSTGSIGVNTLRIVRTHPRKFSVSALAARRNISLLARQAKEFRPKLVCIFDESLVPALKRKLSPLRTRVVAGREGLLEVASMKETDEVIFAMVGAVGLEPIFASIRARKPVAIANKEPLVMAGELLMREAEKFKVPVFPIDSEHSGLWQCVEGHRAEGIKKLVLTSSGGPFWKRKGSMAGIKPAQALRHPKWKMGPKITIDSATLMNKGLEVIEAANLFKVPAKRIEVIIHPQAIVHAMVEFVDGSHLAQLGITDMRLPIQYALSYPERLDNHLPTLNLNDMRGFQFEKPDLKRFPCLALGYAASRAGGSLPAVLNGANEILVEAFLQGKIGFLDIARKNEAVMKKHRTRKNPSLHDLIDADQWSRRKAEELI